MASLQTLQDPIDGMENPLLSQVHKSGQKSRLDAWELMSCLEVGSSFTLLDTQTDSDV